MAHSVFIDGDVGTTGLQIKARLEQRDDINLLGLDEAHRKDRVRRGEMLNACDLAILCLPDDAAREAVGMIENPAVKVIDASTAHRIGEGWTYGFPEYGPGQYEKIRAATRVTNPGCYAISSVAILHPLVGAGVLPADGAVTINAVSGYSGGGKQLIAAFEDQDGGDDAETPFFAYGLNLRHKHVPEITQWSGLAHAPLFVPSVGHYHQGMIVQVPLALWSIAGRPTAADIHGALSAHYNGARFVTVAPLAETAAMARLEPETLNGTNELRLHVFANEDREQAVVMALIDNLGKGASGQAVQNMNIMLGVDEGEGL
ncbi:MAG: N-acetyl-gamma-glutamyl-phosphate reductase [Rhodospirillaceae bacterium]|nr:N-acetyl-gamma-glutamyl-phosphate reductase [Rhodospirillaceae bacterium]